MAEVQFESFKDLCSWLTQRGRKADMASTYDYLQLAVSEEAKSLERLLDANATDAERRECHLDAEYHYLAEINEFLRDGKPRPLTPHDVLMFRRTPHAWAIASQIYEALNAATPKT